MTVLPLGSRWTPQASLIGRPGRSSLVTFQAISPLGSSSITRLPTVQPTRVLPSGSRIAVNGMSGVFASQATLPSGRVLADHLVEQLRDQVVAVVELAGHPGLEVVVPGLGLERDLDQDLPLAVDLQEPGPVAGLGQQDPAAGQRLDRVDLGLRPLELEDDLARRGRPRPPRRRGRPCPC